MKRSPHWRLACAQACLLMAAMLMFLPWLDFAHAATPFVVNSTLDQAIIDEALLEDEAAARAEYLAEFRTDIQAFLSLDTVRLCTAVGRTSLI